MHVAIAGEVVGAGRLHGGITDEGRTLDKVAHDKFTIIIHINILISLHFQPLNLLYYLLVLLHALAHQLVPKFHHLYLCLVAYNCDLPS